MYGGRTRPGGHYENSAGVLWDDKEHLTKLGMELQQGRQFCCFQLQGNRISYLKETGFVPIHDDLHRPTDRSPNYTGGDV